MFVLKLLMLGSAMVAAYKIEKPKIPLPLIPCDKDKDCQTHCKGLKDPEVCSTLTICDLGPKDFEGGPPEDLRKPEGDWPGWKDGVCNDPDPSTNGCKTNDECMNLESEDGSTTRYAERKCDGHADARTCVWSGQFGMST